MGIFIYLFLILVAGSGNACRAAAPTVVVTIKPLHSLVSGVMHGLGTPVLLMDGHKSPHSQSLTVQEASLLRKANVIFQIGPAYESALRRALESHGKNAHIITLLDRPELDLLPVRQGEFWGTPEHSCQNNTHPHNHGDHAHDPLSTDGHIWLDPHNAQAIVKIIARELASLDPQHQALYFSNSQKIIEKLEKLDEEMQSLLADVQNKPYIIYHDGMQYFDRHFHTRAVGALMGCSHSGINAQHLVRICDYIRKGKISCVFSEPQYSFSQLQGLVERAGAKVVALDYLGTDVPAGEDAYFIMMRRLAKAFVKGLTS